MHLPRAVFLSLYCAAPLAAQAVNVFEIYPDATGAATTYVTRMNVGTSAGEMFQEVPKTLFRGVGDTGTSCAVTGFRMSTADENGATQEQYSVMFRKAAPTGGLDATPAGVLLQAGPFLTPIGSGRVGWQITVTLPAPLSVPCDQEWFLGLQVQAAAWTADGQSLYVAYYYPPTTRFIGDNPRLNAPNHSWYIGPTGSGTANAVQTVRVAALTPAAILNMGSIDPLNTKQVGTCYGAGGLYPDISGGPRVDGIEARVRDLANAGGSAVLFLANGIWPISTGISLVGISGHVYLDPTAAMVLLGSATNTSGEAVIPIVPPNVLTPNLLGWTGYFQALTVNAGFGNGRLTNLAAASF